MSSALTPTVPVDTAPRTLRRRCIGWRGGLFAGAWSEVGTNHPDNEDSFRHVPGTCSPRFCGVADGVGGGSHGDLASDTLLDQCSAASPATIKNSQALSLWVAAGENLVQARIAARGAKRGAATMVGVWFVSAGSARVVHVGDCRLFHLTPSSAGFWIDAVTQDQTYNSLNLLPPPGGSGDDPARMVGVGSAGTPPVTDVALAEGDVLLLCSDGLHKFLAPDAIARLVSDGQKSGLREYEICRNLVSAAKAANSRDDVTALIVTRRPWLGINQRCRVSILGALLVAACTIALAPQVWSLICSADTTDIPRPQPIKSVMDLSKFICDLPRISVRR